jgi:DNA topoisomerase-1
VPTIPSSSTSKNSSTTIIRNTIGQSEETTIKEPVSDIKCDKCGAMMIYKNGRFGRFLACSNYPACRNTKSIIEVVEGVTCPKCKSSIIKKYTSHRIFYGCENYPKCDFYTYDIPVKIKCPKCGGVMVQKSDDKGVFVQCLNSSCKEILRRMKKAD